MKGVGDGFKRDFVVKNFASTMNWLASSWQPHLLNRLRPPPGPHGCALSSSLYSGGPCSSCHGHCIGCWQAYPEPVHPERVGVHSFAYHTTLPGLPLKRNFLVHILLLVWACWNPGQQNSDSIFQTLSFWRWANHNSWFYWKIISIQFSQFHGQDPPPKSQTGDFR